MICRIEKGINLVEGVELVEKLLVEGKDYIDKGDPVQASEKLYKVVEECVKLLVQMQELLEHVEFWKEGRWWSRFLGRAVRTLARELKRRG